MSRKSKKQHCRNFSRPVEEIDELISKTDNHKYKTALILEMEGLRAGEISHLRPSWLHIGDKYSIQEGSDYIDIPVVGDLCSCSDCCVQHYIEKNRLEDYTYSKKWYKKMQRRFYRLSKEDRKEYATYWSPKTDAGSRKVWLMNKERAYFVKNYFENNKTIGLQRRTVYNMTKNQGKKIFGSESKKLFPHAVRASCASDLAGKGVSTSGLRTQLGWNSDVIPNKYVKTRERVTLLELKSKIKRG